MEAHKSTQSANFCFYGVFSYLFYNFSCLQAGFSMKEEMIFEKSRFGVCFEGAHTNALDPTLRVGGPMCEGCITLRDLPY